MNPFDRLNEALKEEKKIKAYLDKVGYHLVTTKCCGTCEHSYHANGALLCRTVFSARWAVNAVDELGVCNQYMPKRRK